MRLVLLALIRGYRWFLSPLKITLFGPAARCRFLPCCSLYAYQAIERHGAWRGALLALRRLGRCHPWGGCGPDPVPAHFPDTLPEARHRRRDAEQAPVSNGGRGAWRGAA